MRVEALLPVVAFMAAQGATAAPVVQNQENLDKRWCLFGVIGTSCGSSSNAVTTSAVASSAAKTSTSVVPSSSAKASSAASVSASKAATTVVTTAAAATTTASWSSCKDFDWSAWSTGYSWGGFNLEYTKQWYLDTYGLKPPPNMSWNQVSSLVSKFGQKTTASGAKATSVYKHGCSNPWTAAPKATTTAKVTTTAAAAVSTSKAASSVAASSASAAASKSSASSVVASASASKSAVASSSAAATSSASASKAASVAPVASSASASVAQVASSASASVAPAAASASSSASAAPVVSPAASSAAASAAGSASSAAASSASVAGPASSAAASSASAAASSSASSAADGSATGTPGSGNGANSATGSATGSAAPAATSAAVSYNGFTSGGCVQEVSGRLLSKVQTSSSTMTIEQCTSICQSYGFGVAGVEYGNECYCGVPDDVDDALVSGQCVMPCAGDSTEICGGPNALNIFINPDLQPATINLPTGWTTYGVVAEGTTGRALTYTLWSDPSNTIESCANGCAALGYSIAGTEYSSECYCGNSFSNGGGAMLDDSAAFMACSGNLAEMCGGPSLLSVVTAISGTIPSN
ncbi:uncharacterized protein I303_102266 [Kwoniella dejecticola CBS 10117]|uniref:WSC domain-containing protein n=1 Tax=Kwoniella dejecticola CBS 10117 TaxID=1296121 RepID=A0AAJ8MFC2_9TREE